MITEDVFILSRGLFVKVYFIHFFSPLRNAAAGGREIRASSYNNLTTLTGDVIVNPRNPVKPDSDQYLR